MCFLGYAEHSQQVESLQDAEEAPKSLDLPSILSGSTSELLELSYVSDFDTNGVIYHLGTIGDAEFRNPAESGLVEVRYASQQSSSTAASAVVGREAVRCVSKPHVHQVKFSNSVESIKLVDTSRTTVVCD
jgi:hypothetical protein